MINNLKSIKIKMTKGIQQVRKSLVKIEDARVVQDIQDIKIMVGGNEEIVKAAKMDENNRQIRPKGNDGDTVTRNGTIKNIVKSRVISKDTDQATTVIDTQIVVEPATMIDEREIVNAIVVNGIAKK